MSRLIFEGNTAERLGELFPKPFIEQIRLFDNEIQADVGLYFEVPLNGDESTEYINYMAENLNVFGTFFEESQFNRISKQRLMTDEELRQFYKNSFFTLNFNHNDYRKEIDLSNVEFFFNSEGKRFAKALIEFVYPNAESFLVLPAERYFASFTSFVRPVDEIGATRRTSFARSTGHDALRDMLPQKEERLKNQTSDLVYEKIFRRPDEGPFYIVNTQPRQVYLQADGHYYQKTPLQSLDKRYRKIDLVDHQQVINVINPIVSPFVGSFEEANMIAMTLEEFSVSPRLLTELQKNINKFSNKSRVTSIGKLYESLVDAVADIDNILIGSERLQKRLIPNTRVVDNRETSVEAGATTVISTTNTRLHQDLYSPSQYLTLPFVTRGIRADSSSGGVEYFVKNSSFLFFDYEKSLNYNSYISKIFNPYNILEMFGKNSLNKYYQNNEVEVKKSKGFFATTRTLMKNEFYFIGQDSIDPDDPPGTISKSPGYSRSEYKSYDEDNHYFEKNNYYSKIIEKNFDTIQGLNGYRLRCFEITDLESFDSALNSTSYKVTVTIDDQTMRFYDDLLQKLKTIHGSLREYLDAAEDFCSYNTIDGRFNDFFVDAMENKFGLSLGTLQSTAEYQPTFPWILGPQHYYYIMALINNSWTDLIFNERRIDGSSINIEFLNGLSLSKYNQISPKNGTLEELQDFVPKFKQLVDTLDVGGPIDREQQIYNVDFTGVATLKKIGERTIERSFDIDQQIVDSYEVVDYSDVPIDSDAPTDEDDEDDGGGGIPGAGGGGLVFPPENPGAFLEDIVQDADEEGSGGKTAEEIAEDLPVADVGAPTP
tara:strand:- start:2862 stop:5339 length:2478 start_codon:yes stop_codon:yes gene_type:complete